VQGRPRGAERPGAVRLPAAAAADAADRGATAERHRAGERAPPPLRRPRPHELGPAPPAGAASPTAPPGCSSLPPLLSTCWLAPGGSLRPVQQQQQQQQQQHPPTRPSAHSPTPLQPFTPRVLFSVSHAPASVTHKLSSAIAAAARASSSSPDDRSHVFVKHSVTDDVVHDDYVASTSHGQYTIYLLNPASPGARAPSLPWHRPVARSRLPRPPRRARCPSPGAQPLPPCPHRQAVHTALPATATAPARPCPPAPRRPAIQLHLLGRLLRLPRPAVRLLGQALRVAGHRGGDRLLRARPGRARPGVRAQRAARGALPPGADAARHVPRPGGARLVCLPGARGQRAACGRSALGLQGLQGAGPPGRTAGWQRLLCWPRRGVASRARGAAAASLLPGARPLRPARPQPSPAPPPRRPRRPQHLIWPPLHFSQLPATESLQVQLVYMHNTLVHPPKMGIPTGFLQTMLHHVSGQVQNSSVAEAWLAFSKCELCMAAYSRALKVGGGGAQCGVCSSAECAAVRCVQQCGVCSSAAARRRARPRGPGKRRPACLPRRPAGRRLRAACTPPAGAPRQLSAARPCPTPTSRTPCPARRCAPRACPPPPSRWPPPTSWTARSCTSGWQSSRTGSWPTRVRAAVLLAAPRAGACCCAGPAAPRLCLAGAVAVMVGCSSRMWHASSRRPDARPRRPPGPPLQACAWRRTPRGGSCLSLCSTCRRRSRCCWTAGASRWRSRTWPSWCACRLALCPSVCLSVWPSGRLAGRLAGYWRLCWRWRSPHAQGARCRVALELRVPQARPPPARHPGRAGAAGSAR
jgi:hypothetical protein